MGKYYVRKEIASTLEVSVGQVRANEKKWELDKCLAPALNRCVRYYKTKVDELFKRKGWI